MKIRQGAGDRVAIDPKEARELPHRRELHPRLEAAGRDEVADLSLQLHVHRHRALAIDADDNNALYNVACVYSLLGEADRAVDLLEPYLRKVGPQMGSWFKNDSDFDPIRNNSRYADLVKLID